MSTKIDFGILVHKVNKHQSLIDRQSNLYSEFWEKFVLLQAEVHALATELRRTKSIVNHLAKGVTS